eukprot:311633-Chlamydomonas_euryale.AAC.14
MYHHQVPSPRPLCFALPTRQKDLRSSRLPWHSAQAWPRRTFHAHKHACMPHLQQRRLERFIYRKVEANVRDDADDAWQPALVQRQHPLLRKRVSPMRVN